MQFVHAADLHLDSPLDGLRSRAAVLGREVAAASRRAFAALIDLAIERKVAFVVIAGDVFDGDWRDYHTGLVFADAMARLERAGIAVVLVKGNHDAESRISQKLTLGANVHVFGHKQAQTIRLDALRVALHGQSYGQPALTDNIVRDYPAAVRGWLNIGVLHSALAGTVGHQPYAPCTLDDLLAKGYDYWALGHVHAHQVLHEVPPVIYPGNIQGRHANEPGAKGCVVVDVADGEIAGHEFVALDVVRWARLPIDVADCPRFDDVLDRVQQAVTAAAEDAGGRGLALRLALSGRTTAHQRLHADRAATEAEIQAAAGRAYADAFVERIDLATAAPTAAAAGPHALGEIVRTVAELRGDAAERAALRDELAAVVHKLPDVAVAAIDWTRLDDAVLDAVLAEAEPMLRDRLQGMGEA